MARNMVLTYLHQLDPEDLPFLINFGVPWVHGSQLCHIRQKGHGVVDGGAAQDDTGR